MTELEKNHLIKDKNLETASKYMSLILRHKPEVIGISLDEHGWAEVDELPVLQRRGSLTGIFWKKL